MLVFKRWRWKLSASANKWRWKFPWPFCLCIKNCRGNFHGHFPCFWFQKLSWKFLRPFSLSLDSTIVLANTEMVLEISNTFCVCKYWNGVGNFQYILCLQILKWCWKFPIHFVFANTEMVLEISNTFCVCKYLNGRGNFQYILCLQILKWTRKFPIHFVSVANT